MSVLRAELNAVLSGKLPAEIVTHLLNEYQQIKTQFQLRRFKPSELDGARFAECVLRLLEHLDSGAFTPFGVHLKDTDKIIRRALESTSLPESMRFFVPRLARVMFDVRSKRDVAHVGGEVSPNFSDSLLICHCADWIMTELVRIYHTGSIDQARRIVQTINEIRVPVVAEVDGFVRVQNTTLDVPTKALVILYYKQPNKVSDTDLAKWLRYQNLSRFRSSILRDLDAEAMIHHEGGWCTILPKGIHRVESVVNLELLR